MKKTLYYIADGKMFVHSDNREVEIPSGVLRSYINKMRDSARRNEWKNSGEGAKFTGTFAPDVDVESRIASVHASVRSLGTDSGNLIYSLNIDGTAGIYRKYRLDNHDEGIVVSSGESVYTDFDILGNRMAVSASFAGESHIGVLDISTGECKFYTDGHSWDCEPVWSATESDVIYFCSSGLLVNNSEKPETAAPASLPQLMMRLYADTGSSVKGPSSVCRLNIDAGTMDELLSDDSFDFVRPGSAPDGSVYYIRKPYRQTDSKSHSLGCLLDLLLFPFRLISSFFGFLNFFSMKYSGKTLSKSGNVKQKDEGKLFIDGNLIEAEKELKANRSRGEKYPGIIPHSWELRRRKPDGTDELVRRGVIAYKIDNETGDIIYSNGSAVLCLSKDGSVTKLYDAAHVSFIA